MRTMLSPSGPRLDMGFRPFDRPFYRQLITLALPIAFQSMLSFGVNLLDGVMVGTLGDAAISSVNLANQVSAFLMFFVKGVSAASAVLIAQYWGKQDTARIKTIFGIGMRTSFFAAGFLAVLVAAMPQVVMRWFTPDEEIIALGVEYLLIVCLSYVLFSVSDTLVAMLRNVELAAFGFWVSSFSFLVNLGGNYVLIFGKLGFPAMGVRGAAIATLLTRVVEFCVVFAYTFFINRRIRPKPREILRGDRLLWRDFLAYGVPIIVGEIMWGLVGVGKSVIMGHMGRTAVTAFSIAETVLQLASLFVFGLAGATAVMIGKSVGAKRYDLTRLYAKRIQVIFFVLGLAAAALIYAVRVPAVSFYDVSPAAKDMAVRYLIYGAATIWATCYFASCFQGINRGAGDARFVVTVNLITGWFVVLPLSLAAAFILGWSPPVVFFFTRFDQLVKVFICFFRLRTDKWIRNLTRD